MSDATLAMMACRDAEARCERRDVDTREARLRAMMAHEPMMLRDGDIEREDVTRDDATRAMMYEQPSEGRDFTSHDARAMKMKMR